MGEVLTSDPFVYVTSPRSQLWALELGSRWVGSEVILVPIPSLRELGPSSATQCSEHAQFSLTGSSHTKALQFCFVGEMQ